MLERRPVDEAVHLLRVHPAHEAQVERGVTLSAAGTPTARAARTSALRSRTARTTAALRPGTSPRASGRNRTLARGCRTPSSGCRTLSVSAKAPSGRREGRHAELVVAVFEEGAARRAGCRRRAQAGQLPVAVADRPEVLDVCRGHGRCGWRHATSAAPSAGCSRGPAAASATTAAEAAATAEALRRREPAGRAGAFDAVVGKADKVHRRSRRQCAGRGWRCDQVVALTEGEDCRDVAARQDVVEHAAGLRLADHVRTGVRRVVRILVLEIAVDVDAAGAVLIDEAVAVVVDPFPVH